MLSGCMLTSRQKPGCDISALKLYGKHMKQNELHSTVDPRKKQQVDLHLQHGWWDKNHNNPSGVSSVQEKGPFVRTELTAFGLCLPEWKCSCSVLPLKLLRTPCMTSMNMMYLEHILLKLIEYIKIKTSWEKDVKDLWMLVKWLEHTKALNLKAILPSCSYISASFDHPPFKLLHGFYVLL